MNIIEIYNDIYKEVFCKTFDQSCYVFLCGGASKKHIRNDIRARLEKEHFQIFYPEDLFMEMLNRNKKADLLEYEELLASNSDVICVICESIGSAVELGAFAQNQVLKEKMIVAINQKHERDKSFIMMGPVKHLEKINKDNVVYFEDNKNDELSKKLIRSFKRLRKHSTSNKVQNFDTLSAYIAFIPMVLYFFQTIGRKDFHRNLKEYLESKGCLPKSYNELFNASIKYLIKSGTLITEFNLEYKDETFSLSTKGDGRIFSTISHSFAANRTKLHDKIRCVILKGGLSN